MSKVNNTAAEEGVENTDRELWREREGDYCANSIHVTEGGGIGMSVGGNVIVKPIEEWFALAARPLSGDTKELVERVKAALRNPGGFLDFTGDHLDWKARAAVLAMHAARPLSASGDTKKLVAALNEGEWWQTVVRGPNPTGFSCDLTHVARQAAAALLTNAAEIDGLRDALEELYDFVKRAPDTRSARMADIISNALKRRS